MSSRALSQRDIVCLYNESCILLARWSSWEYQIRYSISKVAYHCMIISQGVPIVSPSANALYDVQLLSSYTYSGCYVLYDNSMILDRLFWKQVESVLQTGCVNIDHAAWTALSKLQVSKFEPVCICNAGISNPKYIVLGKYNKLREIIDETMRTMDDLYFGLRKLGISPQSDEPVTALLEHAIANTQTQGVVEATAQSGTLGAGT